MKSLVFFTKSFVFLLFHPWRIKSWFSYKELDPIERKELYGDLSPAEWNDRPMTQAEITEIEEMNRKVT